MNRRRFSAFKFVGVLAGTTLIFLLGIMLGNHFSSVKLSQVESLQSELRMDTLAIETQSLILSKNPCEVSDVGVMSDELYTMGEKLTFMESQFGTADQSVKRLKNYYSILELRQWVLLTEANKECNLGNNLILYFYSNEVECEICPKQGFVLDYIHKTIPSVKIYSFEYGLNNAAFNTIKDIYNVTANELPVLVINGKKFSGFQDREMLIESIGLSNSTN